MTIEVVIVGGGPAGASTALHLVRREGIRPASIAIVDGATFPREKPCAGAISRWGLRALEEIGFTASVPQVKMRGLRVLHGALGGAGTFELGVVVRRSEFDTELLHAARGDGVVVLEGAALAGLTRRRTGWLVSTSRGEITARHVIACDGAGSRTRKLLGLREPARKGHLYVTETLPVASDAGPRGGLCDFDLGVSNQGLEGYYWDFPTIIGGVAHVSRGIYHANLTPSSRVKEVLEGALLARGIVPSAVKLKPFSTRPFVRGTILAHEGVLFVGEAAGIDRSTGEGIAQSILMAAIAARHVARALRTGAPRFEAYGEEVVRARVGRHLLQSAWLAERVFGEGGLAFRQFLARSPRAREAGARWYRGERLSRITKARLAGLLAWEAARSLTGKVARAGG